MKLFVGLGNPGEKYERMKHNAGYILLDAYVSAKGLDWVVDGKIKAETCRSGDVLYAKPITFMNLSGEAVSKIVSFYKIDPVDITVIHDDVDLPQGKVKVQMGGGSAGHHGIESIIEKLGHSDFRRVRIGIGRPSDDHFMVEEWVLSDLSSEEQVYIEGLASDSAIFGG